MKRGLLAAYDFKGQGEVVEDVSESGKPLNLRIRSLKDVERKDGRLTLVGNTSLYSPEPATKIIQAVRRTGAVTVEAWIRSESRNQKGPARIVTISKNGSERNMTLGQDGNRLDVRLRTTSTSNNGIPSVPSKGGVVDGGLKHVVYTRDRSGIARIYVDGGQVAERNVPGDMRNWDASYRLGLGNELTDDRQWKGIFELVAIYARALEPLEVRQNLMAGPDASASGGMGLVARSDDELLFEREIAPMLARNCVECHDSATREGKLDLSLKEGAFAKKRNKAFIVPGNAEASLVWQAVESGDMPQDKPPLSSSQKELLKKWINGGAKWSLDRIDPAIYVHDPKEAGNWVQRLTVDEYISTVKTVTGLDISKEARELLPRDLRADGFSNTAYNLGVDLKHVQAFSRLAEIIISRMNVAEFAARFNKSQKLIDKDNRDLIEKMGAWILRGPINEDELAIYRGIATTVASAGGDFEEATSLIIETMLQSPRFVYRMEKQSGDGTVWPVTAHELASRMSYILWGSAPDRELMKAADAGELLSEQGIEEQVERMLLDKRAVDRSLQFVSEWLNLGRLKNLNPNPEKFPKWNTGLAEDMRRETLAYFREVVWEQKRPLSALFNTQFSFMTPELARHYGLDPQGEDLARYDLEKIRHRGGLMTQGSVLTMGGDDASMVTRGLFVLHDVLRGTVSDPPPGLDTTPVPSSPGKSHRFISEGRISNESCGGCHVKFEPLAFGLEKFDGLGSFHEKDRFGNVLREDGEILIPGATGPVPYKTSAELMDLLAGSDRVKETLTWKLTQFALGRPLVPDDLRSLKTIHEEAMEGGGTYQSTVLAIIRSDLVRMIRTEKND